MPGGARGSQTVQRVLDAALGAFAEGGLAALSIQEIRERSGVSVGSLYHHFGRREGIVLALYERQLLALLDHVCEGARRARSARGLVRAMVERYLDWIEAHPEAARFILCAAPAELDVRATAPLQQGKLERLTPLLQRTLRHAQAGEIVALSPSYYEMIVIGPVAETSRRWLQGEPFDLSEARTVLAETIWRALAPGEASAKAGAQTGAKAGARAGAKAGAKTGAKAGR